MDIQPYLDRIYAWNPALADRPVRVDPYGLNNLVVVLDDAWVCRFPRTAESRARLAEEARLLEVVRRHVRWPVPAFITGEELDFVAYPLLPGRPLYRHDLLRLDEQAQERFAADLAGFLGQLHAIPPVELADVAPLPPTGSADLWAERLAALRAELYPHLWADQHAYGESFVRRMITTAPAIEPLLERARFRAAYVELEWALKGVRTADPSWYLVHLGRARDSRPFGAAG